MFRFPLRRRSPSSSLPPLGLLLLLTASSCTAENSSVADSRGDDDTGVGGAPVGGDAAGGSAAGGAAPDAATPGGTAVDAAEPGTDAVSDMDGGTSDAAAGAGCDLACDRVADCAAEVCGAEAAEGRPAVLDECATACAANPAFEIVLGGIATCGDVVAFAGQSLGDAFAAVCEPGTLPDEVFPVCDVFGERIAVCMAEVCPNLDPLVDAAAGAYRYFCNEAGNNGEFDPAALAQLLTPETPCDSEIIANIVREQTGPGGDLVPFCETGPRSPAEVCDPACETLAACIGPNDDGAEVRDPDFCHYLCGVSAEPGPELWACVAGVPADACADLAPCFEPGPAPEVAACGPYAVRVAACTVETCGAVAPYEAGLALGVRLYCNGAVAADAAVLDVVSAVTPETDCADPAVSSLVTGLTYDDPAQETDGTLAAYCAAMGGPLTPESCAAACERLGPCVPDGDGEALRDAEYCAFFCGTAQAGVGETTWRCLEGLADVACESVFGCFEAP